MSNLRPHIACPANEPILNYAPGSQEKRELKAALAELCREPIEVPLWIAGEEHRCEEVVELRAPHDHDLVLARVHRGGKAEAEAAIESCLAERAAWGAMPWYQRASIFERAATLLAGPYRARLNAATMLGQSKNAYQAEIDAACELIDFWRFNVHYASELYGEAPPISPTGIWNRMEMRPLEGFVFAVTPFNFTSIAGNLPTAPVMLGNVCVWKPAATQALSALVLVEILREAGLPGGVINMVLGNSSEIGAACLAHPELAGVHFTGSTRVFQYMQKTIGESIDRYKSYPRVVGETGGKDFVVAHESADVEALNIALVRGAFEYQGQKCSAASRAYVPASLWPELRKKLEATVAELTMGSPLDFRNFVNAVIDERAFTKISKYIEDARASEDAEVIIGGGADRSTGWFIEPTVILAKRPDSQTMCEEIFGPVLTIYVYEESWSEILKTVDQTSPYALTGAVFANCRMAVAEAEIFLRQAAGNFYINDKPTGAVVGQQPFGGARASGTNDKAGSWMNLIRWLSPRSVKENFSPDKDWRYPFLEEE